MPSFKTRMTEAASRSSRIILACDYCPASASRPQAEALAAVRAVGPGICAIKVNFHLLLRSSPAQVSALNAAAHKMGIESIADIKLNDIGNTNKAALDGLQEMGFDAVIASPIMGKDALSALAAGAHKRGMGAISLCHMSAPEAAAAYELPVKGRALYGHFLDWAVQAKMDGVVAGATYPKIIRQCKRAAPNMAVYSPGIGAQGGSAAGALAAGTDYMIVGRSIMNAADPAGAAKRIAS